MTATNQMTVLGQRARATLGAGTTDIQAMLASITGSQTISKQIGDQNKALKQTIQLRLNDIESVSTEQSAALISSLTTQLQASYQVGGKLMSLTLASYL